MLRTLTGAKQFCAIRSYVSTAAKHGRTSSTPSSCSPRANPGWAARPDPVTIYQATLRRELARYGFEWEHVGEHTGMAELAGVPRDDQSVVTALNPGCGSGLPNTWLS